MRTKKADVEKRREFMKQLIIKDPTMSGSKLNNLLFKEFGTRLRINNVYDLKEALGFDRTGKLKQPGPPGSTPSNPTAVTMAARNTGETTTFPLLVQIAPAESPIDFAERLLTRLREAGVINLKVGGRGDTWAVIEPAA
jgi:hypothetical protein